MEKGKAKLPRLLVLFVLVVGLCVGLLYVSQSTSMCASKEFVYGSWDVNTESQKATPSDKNSEEEPNQTTFEKSIETMDRSDRSFDTPFENDQEPGNWSDPVESVSKFTIGFAQNDPSAEASDKENKHSKRYNVLFLVSDDLRPQLNSYRGPHFPNPNSTFPMHTPHLDDLATRSLILTRAYSQFAVCGPSRTSLLTGRRPDTNRVWDLYTYWRTLHNYTTIPQYFKDQGYTTAGFGKIFHQGPQSNYDDPISWTHDYYHSPYETKWLWSVKKSWQEVPMSARIKNPLPDEDVTKKAVEYLHMLSKQDKPFFLGVGFHKPHMPFSCPKESYDMYPLEAMETLDNINVQFPKNMPSVGWHQSEVLSYHDLDIYANNPNYTESLRETLPVDIVQQMRRAYFACVSHIDSLVGNILQELDELGLRESTVITFIGDHGFHLGENGMIGKHTNFEQSTHVPFMVSVPGITDKGVVSDSLVELVDLFPTLVEASGLPVPPPCPRDSSNVSTCVEGTSLMTLINQPNLKPKKFALSQMIRYRSMGYSIRTDRYRYNEWPIIIYNETVRELGLYDHLTFWNDLHGRELYDHHIDSGENTNLVDHPSYKNKAEKLSKLLRDSVGIDRVAVDLYSYFKYFS